MNNSDERKGDLTTSRHELLAEVAGLYYNDDLDQKEIAARIGLSRSTVSRMIGEARELNIVEVRINPPLPADEALQERALARYPVREALVLAAGNIHGDVLTRVGRLAARHLESTLSTDTTIAISWGSSLGAVADALPHNPRRSIRVVQMIGAVGSRQPDIDGAELARNLANKLGGSYLTLNAPLVVDEPTVAAALLRQDSVASVLDTAAEAQIALTGLGSIEPSVSSLLRAGFATPVELDEAAAAGIVGDIGGHMLSADGEIVETDLSRRMLRLDVDRLRAIPSVIAVAVGPHKVAVIHAALSSGIVDVIVTDDETMSAVLSYAEQRDAASAGPTAALDEPPHS